MVEGRIRKFHEEVVLLKQPFVMNPDQTIEQLVAETAKDLGSPVTVKGFVRLALGEGVEKKAGRLRRRSRGPFNLTDVLCGLASFRRG